jgi:hypothetical protein
MRNKLGEEQAADLKAVIEKYVIELRKQQQFNED